MTVSSATDLVGGYLDLLSGDGSQTRAYDEFVSPDGGLNPHWATLADGYRRLGPSALTRLHDDIGLQLEQDGVTYNPKLANGERTGPRVAEPWKLDVAPLIVSTDEWATIDKGLRQRAELLDAVLGDLLGPRRLLREGLVPPAMVLADPSFHRPCHGIDVPGPRRLIIGAVDLYRDRDGGWRSYGHRTQMSAGMAYALENRRILARIFPSLFRRSEVRRLASFVRALRATIQAAAPADVENPAVVVLSPGPLSETAFEHAAIASRLGYPLVEGGDLRIRDGQVWLRTVSGLLPVHVILRQIPTGASDPLELWPSSTVGVPGLVDACRDGTVAVINPLGSGLAESFGLMSILPDLADRLLGEELLLAPAQVWWCGAEAERSHVVANLGRIVVRPLSRTSGHRTIDTRHLTGDELTELRDRILASPEQWVGQEPIEPSTAPALVDRALQPCSTVLRGFVVADGDDYLAMPGGLARAAVGGVLNEGDVLTVGDRAGLVAKDTWVLGLDAEAEGDLGPVRVSGTTEAVERMPARAVENLFWLGRYAERAEATVRLLRVVNQRRADFEGVESGHGPDALMALLEATTRVTTTWPGFVGEDEGGPADTGAELFALVTDRERAGTVAYSVDRLMAALDVVRDQMSIDTWLVVGSLQRQIEDLDPEADDRDESVGAVLDDLLHRLLSLSGLATESMVRDQGWQFMDAGRRIERAIRLVALVADTLGRGRSPIAEGLVLESVAMTTESIITYRRRYVWQARVATLLDLLFTDPGNPRSLRFQVDRLTDAVSQLPQSGHRGELPLATMPIVTELSQMVAEMDTDALAAQATADIDPDRSRPRLLETAAELQRLLAAAADALGADYFARQVPQRSITTPIERPPIGAVSQGTRLDGTGSEGSM